MTRLIAAILAAAAVLTFAAFPAAAAEVPAVPQAVWKTEGTPPLPAQPDAPALSPEEFQEIHAIKKMLQTRHRLSLRADGSFKILFIGDMHCDSVENARKLAANIRLLVDREDPSLVIFTGDNTVKMRNKKKLQDCLAVLVQYLEERCIPWAHIYGNHDAEGGEYLSCLTQQGVYESFPYCLSQEGEDLTGVGNYLLPVFYPNSSKLALNIWCLDSGMYRNVGRYDYLKPDQMRWYRSTAQRLADYSGGTVPAIMTFHVPLIQNAQACLRYETEGLDYPGQRGEGVDHARLDSGAFAQIAAQGDVSIIVNSHDHLNDYAVEHQGILLCASATISNIGTTYYSDLLIGARVVVFDQFAPEQLTTYMTYIKPFRQDTLQQNGLPAEHLAGQ